MVIPFLRSPPRRLSARTHSPQLVAQFRFHYLAETPCRSLFALAGLASARRFAKHKRWVATDRTEVPTGNRSSLPFSAFDRAAFLGSEIFDRLPLELELFPLRLTCCRFPGDHGHLLSNETAAWATRLPN